MRRAFKTIVLFLIISSGLLGLTPTSLAENPQVTVCVYNDTQAPLDSLTRAEQRAAGIFSRSGFDVTWLNCTGINSGRGPAACNETDGPGLLVLRIIPRVASSTRDAAFGVAFLGPDGTGRYGDVFRNRVQELHTNYKVDLAGILGSVMAHEMGHLLFGPNAHAISGIMPAHWESAELRSKGTQYTPVDCRATVFTAQLCNQSANR